MTSIISYIEKLLAKMKGKSRPAANKLMSVRGKIIVGGGRSNRKYNKNNLQIAFNKYAPDASEQGEYQRKNNSADYRPAELSAALFIIKK